MIEQSENVLQFDNMAIFFLSELRKKMPATFKRFMAFSILFCINLTLKNEFHFFEYIRSHLACKSLINYVVTVCLVLILLLRLQPPGNASDHIAIRFSVQRILFGVLDKSGNNIINDIL